MEAECEDPNSLGESIGDEDISEINEKLPQKLEENQVPTPNVDVKEDAGDVDKTQIVEPTGSLQSESQKVESVPEVSRNTEHVYENGKRKIKEEKPPTKVVVRRLPPLMTKEIFLEQVSPLPPYDYMYFVSGDLSYGIHSFSRAYLNFINQEDVFTFTRTFDNYVFVDAKGQEYPAVVEFSPFQRVPKQRSKKKDTLTGTIESDSLYVSFKENLLAEALENSKPGAKSMKQHYFETEISTTEEINTTPLLEYLKQRRAEKARIRDERREEKKRKEAERKLKQKAKEKKLDGDEEETKDVKIHHCTVSAEKSFNKGEFTLLLKSEREKVTEKIIATDDKESNSASKGIFAKESFINSDKIIIKKRKERNVDNVNFPSEMLEHNNNILLKHRKPCKESNPEYHCNRQSSISSKNSDLEETKSNSSQIRVVTSICEVKKAEKQTQYLRKILGLSSQDNSSSTEMDTMKSSSLDKFCSTLDSVSLGILTDSGKQRQEPKIYVSSQKTLWCDRNINPALPSASFKTSNDMLTNKNEKDMKTISNPNLRDEFRMKVTKKEDSGIDSCQMSKPCRGEVVIDRALSTNNVLPSAFRKTLTKDSKRDQ
ncbi:uncharacterized protein isoform X2 [Rhodnius prolixus]|uniref:uncharacterized protein isoform X2 n=1 Tax=Rhodnius prolixus TaxID=13249 RepID=UPI003D18F68D